MTSLPHGCIFLKVGLIKHVYTWSLLDPCAFGSPRITQANSGSSSILWQGGSLYPRAVVTTAHGSSRQWRFIHILIERKSMSRSGYNGVNYGNLCSQHRCLYSVSTAKDIAVYIIGKSQNYRSDHWPRKDATSWPEGNLSPSCCNKVADHLGNLRIPFMLALLDFIIAHLWHTKFLTELYNDITNTTMWALWPAKNRT